MMTEVLERVITRARMIFDTVDRYANDRGLRGPHPRPIDPLRFWLVGTKDAANVRHPYDHPEEMVVTLNNGGYHLFFDHVIPYGSTRPIRRNFSEGTYIVRVTSEAGPVQRGTMPDKDEIDSQVYQWIEKDDVKIVALSNGVIAMENPYALPLEPGYAYPFPLSVPLGTVQPGNCSAPISGGQPGPTLLRGGLHGPDGQGVVGGIVSAPGAQSTYQVDSNGQWVLVFEDTQPSDPLVVTISAPNKPPVNLTGVCVIQGCETSLPETVLYGSVLRKGVGIAHAKVQVNGLLQNLEVETQRNGQWMVYLPPDQGAAPVAVTATLPDGSNPVTHNADILPRSPVLVQTFVYS